MTSIWVELLGSEVRFYDVGGIRTRAIEAGEGETIIFLHGVGGHAEAFARNVIPLSGRYRVVSLDYLGHGLTDSPSETPDARAFVSHLLGFMDAAGIDKAHLVGESLGGWIAFWAALIAPDRIGKIISVCGARLAIPMDVESERHVTEGLARLSALSDQLSADPSRENIRARLTWLFLHPETDLTDELVDVRWAFYQRSAAALAATARSVIRSGTGDQDGFSAERLGQIQHPVLMLWTSDNPSTTAATARDATTHLPRGEFVLMDNCAHWPQWERPEEFNRIVAQYLNAPEGRDKHTTLSVDQRRTP